MNVALKTMNFILLFKAQFCEYIFKRRVFSTHLLQKKVTRNTDSKLTKDTPAMHKQTDRQIDRYDKSANPFS